MNWPEDYMASKIELIHGDCMEYMAKMPDKSFDLAIVDPPYGIGDFTNSTLSEGRKVTVSKFNGTVRWNDEIPKQEYFKEIIRVSKEQIIWGANYYNCFPKNGAAIVWYKHTKHPNYSDCEIASYSKGVRVAYVSIEWYSLNRKEITIHPCQKPIDLYAWCLKNYAKEGNKILDTHLGSGSIAIACYDMGYDLTGFEIDLEYYNAAVKRLETHKKQLTLF